MADAKNDPEATEVLPTGSAGILAGSASGATTLPAKPSTASLSPIAKPPRTRPRQFEIAHIDLLQVSDVDIVSQKFSAQIFLSLRAVDGALDECLSVEGVVFPFGEDGRPTFRPSAAWYLSKLDFNNALEYERMDEQVRTEGNDLIMCVRFRGTFAEPMELHDFPFDRQALCFSLCMNTRSDGPLPVEFVVTGRTRGTVSRGGLGLIEHLFVLERGEPTAGRDLHIATLNSGSAGREFPTCQVSAMLRRRPGYVLLNVLLPLGCISFLSGITFLVPVTKQATKLSVSLTLVLTTAAYKHVLAGMLPAINYLTVTDRYVLACSGVVFLTAIEGAIVGAMGTKSVDEGDIGFLTDVDEDLEGELARIRFAARIDQVSAFVAVAIFALIHVWFLWVWFVRTRGNHGGAAGQLRHSAPPSRGVPRLEA